MIEEYIKALKDNTEVYKSTNFCVKGKGKAKVRPRTDHEGPEGE
jgi:hypothetical protein